MTPSHSRALVLKSIGHAAIETVPVPELRDDYILVKTMAVGINPADVASLHTIFSGEGDSAAGSVLGCDYAGTVEAVGSKVTKDLKVGDRVAGPVHGGNSYRKDEGAHTEYLTAKGDLAIKLPDHMSFEQGATLGIGITTVGQSLYQTMGLATPDHPLTTPQTLLIYGASTATGILGVQYAALAGYRVITTSSPHNFAYLRSLGASETFDYRSPTCVDDIRAATGGKLGLAWDCITTDESAALCARAMSDAGGKYVALLYVDERIIEAINPKIEYSWSLYYNVFGETMGMAKPSRGYMTAQPPTPGSAADFEFGKAFWEGAGDMLESRRIKPAKVEVNRGGKGLEGVLFGIEEMKRGNVSGVKLVYTL